MTIEMCIDREEEIEVTVELEYTRASHGARDKYGVPLEPDEDATCEVISATDFEGNEIELTRYEEEKAIEKALDQIAND